MARTALQTVYADFRQGYVTVANPLAYPEGSVKDIDNFDIKDNGTLAKRPGLTQESSSVISTGYSLAALSDVAVSLHTWHNVNNQGSAKLAVIQVADKLYFYKMLDSGIDLSSAEGSIDLPIPSSGRNIEITATSGNGWLFVAHPSIKPQAVKRTETGFIADPISIRIRDVSLWRGETDNQTGYTSSILFPQHEYNLRNAGWPRSAVCSTASNADTGTTITDPVKWMKAKIGKYPRISVPFQAAKAGGGDTLTKQMAFNPWAIENDSYYGGSKPPVGYYIVDAESWQRRGEGDYNLIPGSAGSDTLVKKYSWDSYPTYIEFYSGRVWYAGAQGYAEAQEYGGSYSKKDNLNTSNTIYFSQQLDIDLDKAGLCYQENDPTAEDINQLLSTDGGTIAIRGAGEIFAIKTYRTSLLVFSDQGVWAISGLDGNSFKADSSSVTKISNIGPVSKDSISLTSDSVFFAADDALYVIVGDEISGLPAVQDISSEKIKDFYNELSNTQKATAKLSFDPARRVFYMFYREVDEDNTDSAFIPYTKALVFNQDLGAYYKYSIQAVDNFLLTSLFYNKDNLSIRRDVITIDEIPVTIDDVDVYIETSFGKDSKNGIQLLTAKEVDGDVKLFFSAFLDRTNFEDWGIGFSPRVQFGFDMAGDIIRDSKKAPRLITHMERTETGFEPNPDDPTGASVQLKNPSSCGLSYAWDWNNRYSPSIEIYRFSRNYTPYGVADSFDYGPEVITTKNRIRGKGKSLGLSLEGGYAEDCRILGLGIVYTVAQGF